MSGDQSAVRTELFVNGKSRPPLTNEYYRIFNPARPDGFVGEAASATPDDVNAACEAAHTAFPAWSALFYAELGAGYTYQNGHGPLVQDNRGPFAGFKGSGIERNLGYEGIVEFQEYHSISAPNGWLI